MEYKKISDLATVVTGGTPSTSVKEYWENGNIPWLQSGCCQNCDVFTTENYITQKGYDNSSTRLMPVNTVMIALTGATAGKIGYLKFEACGNQSITGIFPNKSLSQRYLFYYLISRRAQILSDCVGGAQAHISQGYVKNIIIPLVSLNEQKKIASILDQVAAIKAARQKQLDALDELVKARFIEMFGDEGNPQKWDVVQVEDIAKVQVGIVIKPSQYYSNSDQGVKAFRSLNIGEMFIKDNDWVYFSEQGNCANKKTILKENDLLIVRSGAPGTSCVVTKDYEGCNAIDIIIARPIIEKINPYYLCVYTNMPHGKNQILQGTSGAAQQHFNVGKYNKLKITLPPKKMQDKYAAFIAQVDKTRKTIEF